MPSFDMLIILLIVGVFVSYQTRKKRKEMLGGIVEGGIEWKISRILNTDDVDVLEEEDDVWYKVRVGNIVCEAYMSDDGSAVKSITHGIEVIYKEGGKARAPYRGSTIHVVG